MKNKKITGQVALVLSALAVLVVVGVGWFMLVSPQRSKVETLDTQIASLDAQLADAQHLLAAPNRRQTARTLAIAKRALPERRRCPTSCASSGPLQRVLGQSSTASRRGRHRCRRCLPSSDDGGGEGSVFRRPAVCATSSPERRRQERETRRKGPAVHN